MSLLLDYILLSRAPFPGNPSPPTRWRWKKKGIRGIRLKTVMIGGRCYTTEKWCQEFIEATTAAANTPISDGDLSPRPDNVTRQLKAAGVL